MIRLYSLVLLALAGFGIEHAVSDIIRFTGDQYKGEMINQARAGPVGKIGDYAEFVAGSYLLLLAAPHNHLVSIELDVSDGGIEVMLSKEEIAGENECTRGLKTEWIGSVLKYRRDSTMFGAVWSVTIPGIRLIDNTGAIICTQAETAVGSCDRHGYDLAIETDPPNATVWINGKKERFRTPVKNKRGTYCDGHEELHILTRAEGRVTCSKMYRLQPNAEIIFFCEMKKVKDGW